jgi:hypothetical protein
MRMITHQHEEVAPLVDTIKETLIVKETPAPSLSPNQGFKDTCINSDRDDE